MVRGKLWVPVRDKSVLAVAIHRLQGVECLTLVGLCCKMTPIPHVGTGRHVIEKTSLIQESQLLDSYHLLTSTTLYMKTSPVLSII